jgi:LysM repeat protein
MNSAHIITTSFLFLAIVSCASNKSTAPDNANPYGTADAGQVVAPVEQPVNPVYDTPAAYEESTTAATSAATATSTPALTTGIPKAPPNGSAVIHTVVAGDTLSGISAKYKVSSAAIKQANQMTKDTVILGRKMVIPPAQ